MYFKQVEMHGFKSFADRTQILLQPGTTAIVGPNGCGKSNILDAMRWSLGEQSAKVLRGSHMQDVIFNGSEHRSPMGMSEVSLTFDNADSALPVDFAEVTITRRVYRSGESEYLLNKAPCRLRDIQELFMDTGIGTSAYSLIGQGKIDLVLSSKPDDRRYLFEEAAGIIKYKSRKRMALRKLDSADQNLLRLTDIINEVQRQMRSLKRQVNAAIRHRELTEALREIEIRQSWLQYNELSGAISDLKTQFDESSKEYEEFAKQTAEGDAEQEALNLRRVELERMLMARREGEYQVDSDMEKIERQIALFRREIEYSEEKKAEALEEQEQLLERAKSLETSHGETGEQASALRQEVDALMRDIDAKQETHETARKAVEEADAAVEAARGKSMETISTRSRTQTELEGLGGTLESIDEQLKNLYGEQETRSARQAELSEQLNELERSHTESETSLSQTSSEREEKHTTREQVVAELEKLNGDWQTLRERKSSQEARLHSLRELRDSYEGFAVGVRAVMRAKQEAMPEVDGIIGPVGDLLSTESEYAQAVEAALGGNINNVVCGNADAAKSAIGFLKKHQAGRVTFLPLDTIRPSTRDDSDALQGHSGVIGKAINYVQCDAQVMPAFEYLLFNTIIVETIDDAIRIARSEKRHPKLVTLEGEVVTPTGAVTGGRTKHQGAGVVGRAAEIDELETAVDEADGRIKSLVGKAAQLTAQQQELAEALKELQRRETELQRSVSTSGMSLAKLRAELEAHGQSAGDLQTRRDELIQRREGLEQQRATAQERIESMASEDEQIQRAVEDAQEAASKARQALSLEADALGELRVKLAGITQNMEEAERNRIREKREQEEALKEAKRRAEIAESMSEKAAEIESKIKDELERVKALSETKEEAHAKVLETQQEHEQLVKKVDAVTKQLKELRAKTDTAQKKVHALELELTQKEDRIEYLQEYVLNEYKVALSSLEDKDVGADEMDEPEREAIIKQHKKDLQRLGTVNLMAIDEYEALEKRNDFLLKQDSDLREAREKLLGVVEKIDETILEMFMETFREVAENFKNYFRRLFNGGQARVYLLDEDDPLESGIEIEARPPGKKPQVISLLSGGEQAMTAIALLFSIFSAKPSPFCVLDEVDAPLDDANIGRFLGLVDEFVDKSQFIIITHNKQTMAHADALFGVTQQERGVSQIVSVKFDEMSDAVPA